MQEQQHEQQEQQHEQQEQQQREQQQRKEIKPAGPEKVKKADFKILNLFLNLINLRFLRLSLSHKTKNVWQKSTRQVRFID